MTTFCFRLCRIATFIIVGVNAVRAADATRRPNILLIYTDDQSWRTLGCYRNEGAWPWVQTPNIDRLSQAGVRFSVAYGASWCTPSRASLLTGRYQHAVRGVNITAVLKGSYDPAVCRFWPAELRRSGYQTAMIGKWHLGHDAGHGREWDHSVVWDQADISGDWYNQQRLSVDGAPAKVVPGYSTDNYSQYAVDFIRRRHEQPWCLWLCYNAPHLPLTVHPRHAQQYVDAEADVPPGAFGPRPEVPQWQRDFTQWTRSPDADGPPLYRGKPLPAVVRAYNRLVSAVDDGVGRLLEALADTGQLDETLIVFTSDQGFAWGEHGFAWKVGPYDACLRMPLLVRWPGVARPGGVCPHPVTIVDVAATVVAAAGVSLPWTTHGRDLRPLLEAPQQDWPYPAFMEHCRWEFGPQTDHGVTGSAAIGGVPWWLFVRQGRYKYVRTLVPDEIDELYDLENDPAELHNLALDPARRELVARYRKLLTAELVRTEAGMTDRLPPIKESR